MNSGVHAAPFANPFEYWVLSRALCDASIDGEVHRVRAPIKLLLDHLLSHPLGERQSLLEGFLIGRPDRDTIDRALAEVNHLTPAPDISADIADSADGPEGEKEPRPWGILKLGKLPEDPGAPLEVLPPRLRLLCTRIADAYRVDPGVPLMMILSAAAGLIGRGLAVRITPHWKEEAALYVVLIQPAGSGKSPVQTLIMGPIRDIEKGRSQRWKAAQKKADADYLLLVEAASKQKQPKPQKPPPIPQERLLADDVTMEAMAQLFLAAPRTLFLIHDELCELFQGMDQYKAGGKGNSQAKLNKIHSHTPFMVDRREDQKEGKEPIRVPYPCLTIWGNLTPSNVVLLGEHDREGTLERWLPICPDPMPAIPILERGSLDPQLVAFWKTVVGRLETIGIPEDDPYVATDLDVKKNPDEPPDPDFYPTRIIPLGRKARAQWRIHDRAHCDEINDQNFPAALKGTWQKMDMMALRLSITLFSLWAACSDERLPEHLGPKTVKRAWDVITYLKVHHHRAFALGRCLMPHGAKLLCNWIKAHPKETTFSWSDLTRLYPPSRYGAELEEGRDWLIRNNAIRSATPDTSEKKPRKRGRPAAESFEVHPDLLQALQHLEDLANPAAGDPTEEISSPPESAGETGETGEFFPPSAGDRLPVTDADDSDRLPLADDSSPQEAQEKQGKQENSLPVADPARPATNSPVFAVSPALSKGGETNPRPVEDEVEPLVDGDLPVADEGPPVADDSFPKDAQEKQEKERPVADDGLLVANSPVSAVSPALSKGDETTPPPVGEVVEPQVDGDGAGIEPGTATTRAAAADDQAFAVGDLVATPSGPCVILRPWDDGGFAVETTTFPRRVHKYFPSDLSKEGPQ